MRTLDRTAQLVLSALSVLVATSLAAGCGDGDGGNGDVSTGIEPNKLLSDVTEEEAATACTRLQAGFNRVLDEGKVIRALCTLTAAAFADTTADCNSLRDQCIDEATMPGSELMENLEGLDTFECDGSGIEELAECTGTVGQLEACVNDTLDRFDALLNQFSCNDAASLEPEDLENFGDTLGESPASCESVGCPGGSPFAGDEEPL